MLETDKRKRYEDQRDVRFLTFSCYRQLALLNSDWGKNIAVEQLALTHDRLDFSLFAWVVMPNHVHLLLRPNLEIANVTRILSAYKTRVSKRIHNYMIATDDPQLSRAKTSSNRFRLWQHGGGYDRNIWSLAELREKAIYIENNPVRSGLVQLPVDYLWSSANSPIIGRDAW